MVEKITIAFDVRGEVTEDLAQAVIVYENEYDSDGNLVRETRYERQEKLGEK